MSSSPLILTISQAKEPKMPYKFKLTGINVYSFEEALFHTYTYWQQSVDDFCSDEFITWVKKELDLAFLATKLKQISENKSITERFVQFLSIIDYFDEIQIVSIKSKLLVWEKELEWQHLKQRGDYLFQNGDPERAVIFYKKALFHTENVQLLNNTAIALMQLSQFEEAVGFLERAFKLEAENITIVLNLAEAAIYSKDFEKALLTLKKAEALEPQNADIQFLHGELNLEAGNIRYSMKCFENAYALKDDAYYVYRIADVHVRLRQYDRALEALENVKTRDSSFYKKQAEVYAVSNNVPAAIKCIERAIFYNRDEPTLWITLAKYHRMDYDLSRAASAIAMAVALAPENEHAALESARIKKAQGNLKEYRDTLNKILKGFKKRHRETAVL